MQVNSHGVNWYLIAREARRPDGLPRLLQAEFTERTNETTEARKAIKYAFPHFERLRDEARAELMSARSEGIAITTVLDDDYPLNLRIIYNLPPFLFYRGQLKAEEDAVSVAVVGTREASADGLPARARWQRCFQSAASRYFQA